MCKCVRRLPPCSWCCCVGCVQYSRGPGPHLKILLYLHPTGKVQDPRFCSLAISCWVFFFCVFFGYRLFQASKTPKSTMGKYNGVYNSSSDGSIASSVRHLKLRTVQKSRFYSTVCLKRQRSVQCLILWCNMQPLR